MSQPTCGFMMACPVMNILAPDGLEDAAIDAVSLSVNVMFTGFFPKEGETFSSTVNKIHYPLMNILGYSKNNITDEHKPRDSV